MNIASLVALTGTMATFDLALLVQAFDDPRETIRVQLSRWMTQGKVIGLRRGMYTLAHMYRRATLTPALLANQLYHPSYLSGLWALGYYDLIPENVARLTSVTSRGPCRFENPIGVFDYRHIKQESFFGYRATAHAGVEILVAEAEKALLDHWHLTSGEWTADRLDAMRYQNTDIIDSERLAAYAERFGSPRLNRTVERWEARDGGDEKGTVTL